jgi:nicotinamidase-related amidase
MEPAGLGGPKQHVWRVSPREYARHESRRGRRHAFADLDPQRTALVVIDMVRFFAAENPYVRGIVPNINTLARSLRAAQGTVAWVLPGSSSPPLPWATEFYGARVAALYAASGGEGTTQDRLWPELDGRAADVWVEKSGVSAFFPGRSQLPEVLASKGVDTVLITGTVTSVCCESSARDASTLGYRVVMVADGNADVHDEPHNATLRSIYRSFGDVRPTAELLELLGTHP